MESSYLSGKSYFPCHNILLVVMNVKLHIICIFLSWEEGWMMAVAGTSAKMAFFPVMVVSRLFRGKFLFGLKELRNRGLTYEGEAAKYRNHYEFQNVLDTCYAKEWIPFLRESFAGAETVLEYIGRYTHRMAVSNNRILASRTAM